MAGKKRMKIEQIVMESSASTADGDNGLAASTIFKNLFDFLEAHPGTTRIALGYGTGGTGTDYHDGANPFGEQAFAVFRWDTNANRTWEWYQFIGVGNLGSFASLPWRTGGGAATTSYGYVVTSAAVGIGGTGTPWGGTTNNDGTDTIPSPTTDMWVVPSGGGTNVKVIPSSNSTSGSGAAEDQNEVLDVFFESSDGYGHRAHFWADDDSIAMAIVERDDTADHRFTMIGRVDAVSDGLSHNNPLFGFTLLGGYSGAEEIFQDYDGGVTAVDDAEASWQAAPLRIEGPAHLDNTIFQPNRQTGKYGAFPIEVLADTTGEYAYIGTHTDLVRLCTKLAARTVNSDKTRIVIGEQSPANNINYVLPWDGTTAPDSGTTRAGVDYTEP